MLFMTITEWEPENRAAILERYRSTGGMPPLPGVKRLGRWTDMGGGRVFVLSEVEDPVVLSVALQRLAGLAKITVVPVLNDEQTAKVLSAA